MINELQHIHTHMHHTHFRLTRSHAVLCGRIDGVELLQEGVHHHIVRHAADVARLVACAEASDDRRRSGVRLEGPVLRHERVRAHHQAVIARPELLREL